MSEVADQMIRAQIDSLDLAEDTRHAVIDLTMLLHAMTHEEVPEVIAERERHFESDYTSDAKHGAWTVVMMVYLAANGDRNCFLLDSIEAAAIGDSQPWMN